MDNQNFKKNDNVLVHSSKYNDNYECNILKVNESKQEYLIHYTRKKKKHKLWDSYIKVIFFYDNNASCIKVGIKDGMNG